MSRELLQQPVSPKRKPSSAALPSLGPTLLHSTSVLSPSVQRVRRSSMLLAARPVLARGPCGEGNLCPLEKVSGTPRPEQNLPGPTGWKLPGTNCVKSLQSAATFQLQCPGQVVPNGSEQGCSRMRYLNHGTSLSPIVSKSTRHGPTWWATTVWLGCKREACRLCSHELPDCAHSGAPVQDPRTIMGNQTSFAGCGCGIEFCL